jgi:uncharacterized membrane protein YbhN (UPF0104 family)
VGISGILLVIAFRQVEWGDLRTSLAQISLPWLAAAWSLFLLGIVVRAMRWQVLLQALDIRRPLRELVLWYFAGSFFNVMLPTGFGGDAVRVVEVAQDTQRVGAALNSVVVDRYLGLMSLLAMGLVAGMFRPDLAPGPILGLIGLLLVGGILAAWLLTRPWWSKWAQRGGFVTRLLQMLRLPDVAAGLSSYSPGAIARAFLVSIVFNLLQIFWNVMIGLGLGLQLPIALYFVIVPLTAAALLLPAFGGLGVRELSYVALLGSAGVPQATALAFSLSIYAITVATGLLGGVLYFVQGLRRTRGKT